MMDLLNLLAVTKDGDMPTWISTGLLAGGGIFTAGIVIATLRGDIKATKLKVDETSEAVKLNQSKQEVWQKEHDAKDDHRFEDIGKKVDQVWAKVSK